MLKTLLLSILLCVGCSSIPSITPSQLPGIVAKNKVVVVMFCKDMCPPCETQASVLFDLAKEFPTVKFVRVKAYDSSLTPTDEKMVEKYNLKWTPTTVLHVNGEDVYAWVTFHGADQIRPMLSAAVENRLRCAPAGCEIIRKK